jgi:hypothetical protein
MDLIHILLGRWAGLFSRQGLNETLLESIKLDMATLIC